MKKFLIMKNFLFFFFLLAGGRLEFYYGRSNLEV